MRKLMLNGIRRSVSSLRGCLIYFGVVFAVPEWLYFGYDLHKRGMLSVSNGFLLAILAFAGGAIVGALCWWTIFKPLKHRLSR
jgi:hypothetical protein